MHFFENRTLFLVRYFLQFEGLFRIPMLGANTVKFPKCVQPHSLYTKLLVLAVCPQTRRFPVQGKRSGDFHIKATKGSVPFHTCTSHLYYSATLSSWHIVRTLPACLTKCDLGVGVGGGGDVVVGVGEEINCLIR